MAIALLTVTIRVQCVCETLNESALSNVLTMKSGFGHGGDGGGCNRNSTNGNSIHPMVAGVVGQAASNALTNLTHQQEKVLDNELDQYDALLKDDDALDLLRERRLREWKQNQRQRQVFREKLGHGEYSELSGSSSSTCTSTSATTTGSTCNDIAKAFFDAAKLSERMVVHFYRPSSTYCQVFHKHFTVLAQTHLETRFVKINVESASEGNQGLQYLVDKLHIHILPTVSLIYKRQQVHQFRGLDDLGGHEDFSIDLLKRVLASFNVLTLTSTELDTIDQLDHDDQELMEKEEYRGKKWIRTKPIRKSVYDAEDDNDSLG